MVIRGVVILSIITGYIVFVEFSKELFYKITESEPVPASEKILVSEPLPASEPIPGFTPTPSFDQISDIKPIPSSKEVPVEALDSNKMESKLSCELHR